MRYCQHCILPDTRPNLLILEDGICNACHHARYKKENVNWQEREKSFLQLTDDIKKKNRNWDCVIPVSGGKDSVWQTLKALEYGLKPLCVTWRSPARNSLGQKNLDTLIGLGVDHIDFSINPDVEKIFTLETLKQKSSTAIPMHMAIFALPLQIAIKFHIPLILWGENSGVEYGGRVALGHQMNREWLLHYGVTQGTLAQDWVSDKLSLKNLSPYIWPQDEELRKADIKALFLGHYFPWDPKKTYKLAQKYGFEALSGKPKTGIYAYADIDDAFLISIHHWLKWYKFGFTRAWDNLSLEIRNRRLSRHQAIETLKRVGHEEPVADIQNFCHWVEISFQEFHEIIEKFRNKNIWFFQKDRWKIQNFLIKEWVWV